MVEDVLDKIKGFNILNDLLEKIKKNILIIKLDGKILFGNSHVLQMYGYAFDELINLNITDLIDHNSEINDLLINAHTVSTINYKKDGTKFFADINPIYINTESDLIIINVSQDAYSIYETLKNNCILSKTLEMFEDAFVIFTKNFNIFQWSKSAEKKFGYSMGDILGKNIKILIPGDRLNEFENKVEVIKQGITIESYITKRLHKNGSLIDVSITMAPLYDCNGKFNGIFGIYKDISEKVKLEEQLKGSEERLRFALEGGRFGVWDWNIITRHLNDPYLFKEFLKYDDSEIEYSIDYFFSKIHPDDISYITEKLDRHFKGEEYDVEFRMKCKNDEYKWIRSKGKVHTWSADGKPLRMIGTNEDITEKRLIAEELKKKCKQLEKLKKEAENANKAKSQFLANMSHEIRTPMNGIFGLVQLIKLTNLNKEQMKHLELIDDSLKNLKVIIDDILDISKIESGNITINEEAFDLRNTVNSIYSNLLITGNSKGLEISYYLDPNLNFKIVSDELKIKQILNNLICNAVKFTNNGYISFRTKIIADYGDTVKIEFRIKDTGIGIEAKYKSKLFQGFSQGDISINKKFQGTGLGLAISKQLADLLKGELTFESKLNEGSTFIFTGEFKKNFTITKIPANTANNMIIDDENNHNQEFTILCVEDNIISQEVMGGIITKKGYKYLPAYNGKEALQLIKENKVDLILMDIQLPELNGYQTTELIRKEVDAECNIPIVAITAYAMREDRDKCLEAGIIDYISKPFSIEELYEILEKHLK